MKGIIYLHIHLKEATIANCEIESLQNHRLLTNTTSIAKIQCYVCWLWNATTIVLRHSQTKWLRTTRTPNLFTSLVFSTHLLLPRARPRAIKGLLKCGLKGLLKCGIKAWDMLCHFFDMLFHFFDILFHFLFHCLNAFLLSLI